MTHFRRTRSLAILLVISVLAPIGMATPAQAQRVCDRISHGVNQRCSSLVSSDSESGGEATTISCDYDPDLSDNEQAPCMVTDCIEHVADDSIYAATGGLAWDPNSPWDRPMPNESRSGIGGLVLDIVESELYERLQGEDTRRLGYFSGTGQWLFCQEVDHWNPDPISPFGTVIFGGSVNNARFVPVDGPIDSDALYNQAYADATPTDPEINFAPADLAVVQMPAWFWVGEYWHNWEATATDGRISVTVRAEPQNTIWETGESTIDCVGEEENKDSWRSGLDPWTDSDCSYIYENSTVITPSGFYDLTATTHYLAWFDLTVNGTTELTEPIPGGYQATSSQPLEVEEILSVAVTPRQPTAPLTQD